MDYHRKRQVGLTRPQLVDDWPQRRRKTNTMTCGSHLRLLQALVCTLMTLQLCYATQTHSHSDQRRIEELRRTAPSQEQTNSEISRSQLASGKQKVSSSTDINHMTSRRLVKRDSLSQQLRTLQQLRNNNQLQHQQQQASGHHALGAGSDPSGELHSASMLAAAGLPPELTDDSDGGEVYLNEDGSFESTGPTPTTSTTMTTGSDDQHVAETLMDLPGAMQLHQQAAANHNLRLMRQPDSQQPQPTRFNLDQVNTKPQNILTSTMASVARAVAQQLGPRNFQQQAQQQQAASSQQVNLRAPPPQHNPPQEPQQQPQNPSFGGDRMLIKHQHGASTVLSPSEQEMVTETVNHELLSRVTGNSGQDPAHELLLYPPSAGHSAQADNFVAGSSNQVVEMPRHQLPLAAMQQPNYNHNQQQQQMTRESMVLTSGGSQQSSVCYTQVAMLMVIMVTMLVTVVVCFAAHLLIKHFGRHQFDLIANTRHFDTRHGSGYLNKGQSADRRVIGAGDHHSSSFSSGLSNNNNQSKHFPTLSQSYGSSNRRRQAAAVNGPRDDGLDNCAFDNPYFRDEQSMGYLRNQQQQHQQQQQQQLHQQQMDSLIGSQLQQKAPIGSEQLNFIEHHISNLHNKQVTSSVKELSILGSPGALSPLHPSGQQAPIVVDLTSEEQRAKVMADPKEGDLIAVDITGHDFIGLGFDVCGSSQEGIFIRSVLARGPARESGCIQPGDRIKCLNISFDNITLDDACDILNCGSPYKMRLLIEKQAPVGQTGRGQRHLSQGAHQQQAPAPIVARRIPRNSLLSHHQLLAAAASSNPKSGSSPMSGSSSRYLSEQRPPSSMGAIAGATKSYLRRLASLITPSSTPSSSAALNYRNNHSHQFGVQTPTNQHLSSHNNEMDSGLGGPLYLGSAAARRRQSGRSLYRMQMNGGGQLNACFDDRSHHELDLGADDLEFGAHEFSGSSVGVQRRMSRGSLNSLTGNSQLRRSRFSVDSSRLFGDEHHNNHNLSHQQPQNHLNHSAASTSDVFGPDSSLDYRNANANHRLHGPQVEVGGAGGHFVPRNGQRRPAGKLSDRAATDQHLEQSQSQPEIATSSGADNKLLPAADAAAAVSSETLTRSKTGTRSQVLTNSASTPTMNLLAGGGGNQPPPQSSGSSAASSGRLKGAGRRESIREEAGSESSYADSTSKLVGGVKSTAEGSTRATSTARKASSGSIGDLKVDSKGTRSSNSKSSSSKDLAASSNKK